MHKKVGKRIALSLFGGAFLLVGGLFFSHGASAATGSIYLSASPASVQNGSTVTISIRINPGTTVDSVQGTLNFDTSKLQFIAVNTASSAFSTELSNSQSGSTVSFGRGDFGSGVSTDSLIETVSFKALAGSGSSSLTLSGANADAGGTFTNPSVAGTSVSFTTPPATCPAGQTGTPPNCVTPPSGGSGGSGNSGGTGSGSGSGGSAGSGSSSGSTKGSGSSSGSGGSGSSSNGGSSSSTSTSSGTAAQTGGVSATVASKNVQYTAVSLSTTSKSPTQVYIRYGVDGQLATNTPLSDFATSHTISLDPTLLVPGEQYSYVVVSTDQQGHVTQSAVQHFTTKGLQVTVAVFDADHKPLRNKTVTLHSSPLTAKTDGNGFVTFSGVSPGDHHVLYTAGGTTYQQPLTVANDVQTSGSTQTAPLQNFSVIYASVHQSNFPTGVVWLSLAVLVVALLVVLMQTGRLGVALQLRRHDAGSPLISQPTVVGSTVTPPPAPTGSSDVSSQTGRDLNQRLNALTGPSQPQPGSTIAPRTDRSELTDHQTGEER